MGRLKVPFIYGALTVVAGMAAESPQFILISMGLSLLIPALFFLSFRENITYTLGISVLSLGALALYNLRAPFDILPFQLMGAIISKSYRRPEISIMASSLLLFLFAVVEELLFGLPKELKASPLFNQYRFGLYFFTSLLFSEACYGISLFLIKRGELFLRLKFGFWTVPLFLIFGILYLTLPEGYKDLAINGLALPLSLFTAQGVAVSLYFIGKTSPLLRLIILLTVLIFPLGFLALAMILGFLDNWLDFRKQNTGGEKWK